MRYVFLPIVFVVTLLLGFAALEARADSEFRAGADWVRITALPCNDAAVVERITASGGDPKDFRAASAEVGGQAFAACWRPDFPRQLAHIVFEDGDMGLIPFALLKPTKEA